MSNDLHKLISGSDVRGRAMGEDAPLTPEIASRLGAAFAGFLAEKLNKPVNRITVALGRDSRLTGPSLLQAAAEGIVRAGASVQDYGMCTTPAMFMAILTPGFRPDGSIMITASHHPSDRNGLKFVTAEGGLTHDEIGKLVDAAENPPAE